ncbi:HGGxSTG domain-containing protein [Methylobacterium nigriterrae]|uniref:HGGxSTG domain-containing protein n=1 Tax=Methylobacterium nigriterrae TaxID=3127512 RepID=UPI0030133083
MHLSPRCGAKTRSGRPCCSPAMPNGRCRMHGGASPGAPKGERNGMYRHGGYTNEAVELRRELNEWVRLRRQFAEEVT